MGQTSVPGGQELSGISMFLQPHQQENESQDAPTPNFSPTHPPNPSQIPKERRACSVPLLVGEDQPRGGNALPFVLQETQERLSFVPLPPKVAAGARSSPGAALKSPGCSLNRLCIFCSFFFFFFFCIPPRGCLPKSPRGVP